MLTWLEIAAGERISNVALVANTDGDMVPHSTVGIDATQARTGVLTFPVDAGLVRRAVSIYLAFRSTVGW